MVFNTCFFLLFLPFRNRKEMIRRGREARKAAQDRWDELEIAEEHDFNTVERYRLSKATGKEKALATAIEKGRPAKKFNSGYGGHGRGGYGGYGRGGGRGPSRGSPSPKKERGRSPNKQSRGGHGGFNSRGGGHGRGFSGRCNNCDERGHMWRDCPKRT